MEVYTIQLGKWRKAKDMGLTLTDITWKTGEWTFAPSQELLFGYKKGRVSQEEYVERYTQEMRESYVANRPQWDRMVTSTEPVVLACYCNPGAFCHRLLLKDILEKVCASQNQSFAYNGEIV